MKDGQLLGQANWGRARCLRHELLSSSGWIRNYKFGRAARATNGGNQYGVPPFQRSRAYPYALFSTAETPRARRIFSPLFILFQFCHPDPERKPKGGSAVLGALYVLRQFVAKLWNGL